MNIFIIKMIKIFIILSLMAQFHLIFTKSASPAETKKIQTVEKSEEGDEEYNEEEKEENQLIEYEFNGFIEYEGYINTSNDQKTTEKDKKNEIRNNIKLEISRETISLEMDMNFYISSFLLEDKTCFYNDYKYAEKFTISRNLRISDESYEITFRELFLNILTDDFRIRAGNQIIGWGTADLINPTAYFNPLDARELLFKDEDELRQAVPSVSLMVFTGTDSLEIVWIPLHIPMLQAESGSFWTMDYDGPPIPIHISTPDGLDFGCTNYAYGARYYTSFGGFEISISGYHGPDPEPIIVPLKIHAVPGEPFSLLIGTEYHISNYIGIDFSSSFDKFVVQFEAAYSWDKTGALFPGGMTISEVQDITYPNVLQLPFRLKRSKFISYSVGLNYFVPINRIFKGHEGESVLIAEWHDAMYITCSLSEKRLEENKNIVPSLMANVLLIGYRDSFFSGRVNLTLAAIFDIEYKSRMYMPKVGFDFMDGLTIDITYGRFDDPDKKKGEIPTSLFGYFADRDVVIIKAKYRY